MSYSKTKCARKFLSDDNSHDIEGLGRISMKGNNEKKVKISNVDLVPKLTKNILSMSQITQHGYKMEFSLD